jgi:ATP-dependent Clp protease ATP-binding subunit ClpC
VLDEAGSCATIENHEFEKARFYADEERIERANLDLLRKEYKLKETAALVEVTLEDIEGVVTRWTGATLDAIRKFRPPAGDGSKEKDS